MTKRDLTRWALGSGIAAAICASTLPAQTDTTRRDTTRTARSTTRIPIRKESRGEVVIPPSRVRADSIALQARRDSMRRADLARNDSIVAAERIRTDSVNLTIRPDSSGLAARGDSIVRAEQFRTDSISRAERARNDSIARTNPAVMTPSVVVPPSTNAATPPTTPVVTPTPVETQTLPPSQGRRLPGSFYMGLAAGSASPTKDLQDLGYDSGLSISVPIGWHNPAALFGWRLMFGYNQFNGASFTTAGANPLVLSNPDPKVYSAELNLNARLPFNERKTSSVYLTGGGGVYMFRNFGQGSALGAYLGNDVLDPNDSNNESTINKWGINGGAGLEFGIGTSSLFLETRLVNVFAGRDDEPNFDSAFGERGTSVRWFPLILGFTIR